MHNHNHRGAGLGKMGLLMAIGCVLPLIVLAVIYVLNVPMNMLVIGSLVLLCPLSHLLVMRSMGHSHRPKSGQPEE